MILSIIFKIYLIYNKKISRIIKEFRDVKILILITNLYFLIKEFYTERFMLK